MGAWLIRLYIYYIGNQWPLRILDVKLRELELIRQASNIRRSLKDDKALRKHLRETIRVQEK